MFQTAPDDEELVNPADDKTELVDKLPEDEDGFESDASSDILQPTQVGKKYISVRLVFL